MSETDSHLDSEYNSNNTNNNNNSNSNSNSYSYSYSDSDSDSYNYSDNDSDENDSNTIDTCSVYDENNTEVKLKDIFTPKEICQYVKIKKYFDYDCPKDKIKKIIKIINSKSSVSLRILDFFVSKYSKHRGKIDFTCVGKPNFDVRISYEAQLKSCKKRGFDPFKRKKKFYHYYTNDNKILTTIGQLNFFKWAIENKIIEYVIGHKTEITDEMKKNTKITKEQKNKKKINKKNLIKIRKNLSVIINKNKSMYDDECEMTIDIM
jgi:hypothetical protein